MYTHSSTLAFRRVSQENFPHVLDLRLARDVEQGRREVALEGAEEQGAELQLQVLVAVWLVIRVGVQPQAMGRVRRDGRRKGTVSVAIAGAGKGS